MDPKGRRAKGRRTRWAQITDGARKVFFEKGYQRATIEDIEKACGLTRGSIYYHFSGKDELYIAVLVQGVKLLRDELRWVSHECGADPVRQVVCLLDAYCDFYREQKEYHRILQHFTFGWDGKDDLRKDLVEEINRLIFDCVQEIASALEQGKKAGMFAIDDPFLESVQLWCMVDSALGKTSDNPRTAFLGIDRETMEAGLKRNILKHLGVGDSQERPGPVPAGSESAASSRTSR